MRSTGQNSAKNQQIPTQRTWTDNPGWDPRPLSTQPGWAAPLEPTLRASALQPRPSGLRHGHDRPFEETQS